MAGSAILSIKILTDASKAASGLDQAQSKVTRFQSGVKKASAVAAVGLAALGAAAFKAADAAAEDQQAQAILANTLKKSAGATDDQVASTEDWISKTATATAVADDQLRPALGNLVRATGDVTKAQSLMGTALDVSAATGTDLESVSKALAKAQTGNTTSLKKLVPSIDAAVLASGDMNKIQAELAKTTGGAAAAAADTAAGKMQNLKNQIGEAQESMGAALLPVMAKVATVLGTLAAAAAAHPRLFQAIAVAAGVLAVSIMVLNVAMTVLAANPIVLLIIGIVAAVALLTAGVILLVRNWNKVWGSIRAVTLSAVNAIKSAWKGLMGAITGAARAALSWLRANWPTIIAILTGPIGIAVLLIVKNWQKISEAATRVFDTIKRGWNATIGALKSAVSGLGAILSAPFDVLKGAIDRVISAVGWLIDKLSKIHVPKINLPGPLSLAAAPASTGPALRTARGATAPAAVAAAGPSVTINVSGAIDPEATARQIRRILAGHTRRVGLAVT